MLNLWAGYFVQFTRTGFSTTKHSEMRDSEAVVATPLAKKKKTEENRDGKRRREPCTRGENAVTKLRPI